MRYSVEVVSAPPAEPLTLTETKLHLKVDVTDDDTLITALIQAAREWVESYCRRSLVQRTLELRLDGWPVEIRLPRAPVASLSSVTYTDGNGNTATLAADQYQVDLYGTPPRIVRKPGVVWPVLQFGVINGVQVTYVAGYAPGGASPTDYAENVPAAIKAALKLLIGHWYENRQAVSMQNVQPTEIPLAVRAILAPFEIRDFTLE